MAMFCPDCQENLDEVPVGEPCPGCRGERRSAVVQAEAALVAVSAVAGTVKIGYNRNPSWTVRWAAIQRGLADLRDLYQGKGTGTRGNLDLTDTVEELLTDLYHLRDWLHDDSSVPLSLAAIDPYIAAHPATLVICRAFANTDKHRNRTHATDLVARIVETTGNEIATIAWWPKGQPGAVSAPVDALDLAERSERDWRALLTLNGIPMPPP